MSSILSNIDAIIFIVFLSLNLLVGLHYIKQNNIEEYAIGRRNFSTATIATTLIATWITGNTFLTSVTKAYSEGLFYIIPTILGDVISCLITCAILAPRMGKFLGSISLPDVMGKLYGSRVKFITCIASGFYCTAKVAIQFYVSAIILQFFFDFPTYYSTIIVACVIIFYSALGGIKGVTFTDIIQLFTFTVTIPIVALAIWQSIYSHEVIIDALSHRSSYNISNIFDINHPKFYQTIATLFYFSFPLLNPAIFQRILMAKNTRQISLSFLIAFIGCIAISILFIWIGILLVAGNGSLTADEILPSIVNTHYAYIGFKGIVAVGIISMIMSTADSYLHIAAITLFHDLPKSVGVKFNARHDIQLVTFGTAIIGSAALLFSLAITNLFSWFLVFASFYAPIVSVPLTAAIFGFKTSPKCVIIAMVAGFTTVLLWYSFKIEIVHAVIPGIFANIIFLFGFHYLFHEIGGFEQRVFPFFSFSARKMINTIKNSSFGNYSKITLLSNEITYIYTAFFIIISLSSSIYMLPEKTIREHASLSNLIYHSSLLVAACFLTYPIWSPRYKNRNLSTYLWFIGISYSLIFSSSTLAIISHFNKLQIILLIFNLIIVATLFKWHIALLSTIISIFLSREFYKYYMEVDSVPKEQLQFKIIYSLALFFIILILFFRPKQKQQEIAEEKNEHLAKRVMDREDELGKLLDLKYEFLRNINHEIHTPMTGIMSLGQTLWSKYDMLSDKQRRQAVEVIAKSSVKLNSLMNNILDFSKLSSLTYDLNKAEVNITNLIYERIAKCKTLYANDKEIEFILELVPDIFIACDKYYIEQTIDNLIINSITYSREGKIFINLFKNKLNLEFRIRDDGSGIPDDELEDVFGVFIVGSKAKTPSGGRGVGLALCKKVIELHSGRIWAENKVNSKDSVDTTIIFNIPLHYEE